MTLLDFEELTQYWSRCPPVHLMLASFFGIQTDGAGARAAGPARSSPTQASPPQPQTAQARAAQAWASVAQQAEVAAVPGVAQADAKVQAETPGVVFDFDQLKQRYLDRTAAQPRTANG